MEVFGTWAVPSNTANAGTAFDRLIPPYKSGGGGPYLAKVDGNGRLNQPAPAAFSHVSSLIYADTGTSHQVTVMRPLNWTYLTAALASAGTTLALAADPGLYSTAYKYPTPGGHLVASVANNAIAANDYVAFQLRDGSWHYSTVASGSGTAPVLTTAVPTVTGGGADAGTVVYFFGISTDKNPQTNLVHHYWLSLAGTARLEMLGQGSGGTFAALNRGDPMIIYSANATNAGTLISASGFYANR